MNHVLEQLIPMKTAQGENLARIPTSDLKSEEEEMEALHQEYQGRFENFKKVFLFSYFWRFWEKRQRATKVMKGEIHKNSLKLGPHNQRFMKEEAH